jgi:hypothetical protein
MNCQTCRIEIEELETGSRLSDQARAHLHVCHVCRAFHDERQALRRLVGSLETVSAPPDFDFRLRARINAAKSAGNHRPSWRSFLASAPALGLAASFVLLIAGFIVYNQMKSTTPASNQQNVIATQPQERQIEQASVNPISVPEESANAPQAVEVNRGNDNAPATTVAVKNTRPRVPFKHNTRRESGQLATNAPQGVSNDLSSRPATQIVPDGVASSSAPGNQIVELPIRSASNPMKVFVDDRSGAKRAVTLEPVIFGSQDFTGRSTSRLTSSHGIW